MEKKNTATFIGHRDCTDLNPEILRTEIIKFIEHGVTTFLNGGMGKFDWLCARIIFELKHDYPNIENYLIIPYLSFHIPPAPYFDDVLYPEGFEKYHFKAAISMRNQYLVDHSSYALCYVLHSSGGAAKTYEYAQKQDITITNLAKQYPET